VVECNCVLCVAKRRGRVLWVHGGESVGVQAPRSSTWNASMQCEMVTECAHVCSNIQCMAGHLTAALHWNQRRGVHARETQMVTGAQCICAVCVCSQKCVACRYSSILNAMSVCWKVLCACVSHLAKYRLHRLHTINL